MTASAIDVTGGVQQSGNATFHPAPATGVASVGDPLSRAAGAHPTGLTNWGSVKLTGNAQQRSARGIYSQISASGNAS